MTESFLPSNHLTKPPFQRRYYVNAWILNLVVFDLPSSAKVIFPAVKQCVYLDFGCSRSQLTLTSRGFVSNSNITDVLGS